jgi:hypothetical protein
VPNKKRATKPKGGSIKNSKKGRSRQTAIKSKPKRTIRHKETSRQSRRPAKPSTTIITQTEPTQVSGVEDTGAVQKARASVEDIVEEAREVVKETTEPTI